MSAGSGTDLDVHQKWAKTVPAYKALKSVPAVWASTGCPCPGSAHISVSR
jgi:hypothetical protein